MIFLGIDGGGSKTSFLLENENGQQLGQFTSGPSNWLSAGEAEARRQIAAGAAQLNAAPDVIGAGFAGAGRPEGLRFYIACLAELFPSARTFVDTDAFIAYVGAIGLKPGVLLLAGTGSIAIGRRQDGTMIRVGGWGPTFSDEGSGFWIGREAIRMALHAVDTKRDPQLSELVQEVLGLTSIYEVVGLWNSGKLTVAAVASVAAVIISRYDKLDTDILEKAAAQLAELAFSAISQVAVPDCPRCIAGSIGTQPLIQELIYDYSKSQFQPPLYPPQRGAIIWARSQVLGSPAPL